MIPTWALRWVPTAILVAAIGLAAAWAVYALREQGRAELRPQIAQLRAELDAEKEGRRRAETAANAYFAELGNLARRPVPAGPVRLCRNTAPVPPTVFTAPSADGSTSRAGGDPEPPGGDLDAGPDIGPALYGLARTCDAEIAKLRALQGWVNELR